jgi:hypothetical protein
MAQLNQSICDGCGKVIFSKNARSEIKKPYLGIRGQIRLNTVDPHTNWGEYRFITPSPNEELQFCINEDNTITLDCLLAYIEDREKTTRMVREQKLRAEADVEYRERRQREVFEDKRPYPPRYSRP